MNDKSKSPLCYLKNGKLIGRLITEHIMVYLSSNKRLIALLIDCLIDWLIDLLVDWTGLVD